MHEVVGGGGPHVVRRVCSDRDMAERLAREISNAGVQPIRIDGIPWQPPAQDAKPERA